MTTNSSSTEPTPQEQIRATAVRAEQERWWWHFIFYVFAIGAILAVSNFFAGRVHPLG